MPSRPTPNDPIAPNVLERKFETDAPDKAWVAGITYIWTNEGWMYLATIIDLLSRRVVGWSMAGDMRTELSRRASRWDNAVAESFLSTLETELVHNVIFMTKASAKTGIAEWIGIFYNGKRRHSTIGYISPVECERRDHETLIAAEDA